MTKEETKKWLDRIKDWHLVWVEEYVNKTSFLQTQEEWLLCQIPELIRAIEEHREVLSDLIGAMDIWGSWEDGVPQAGADEFGSVGMRYNRACKLLGLPVIEEDPSTLNLPHK